MKKTKARLLVGIGALAAAALLVWMMYYYLPAKKGDRYFEVGDYLRAAENYESGIFLHDRYQEAMYMEGNVRYERGDYLDAIFYYRKAGSRAYDRWANAAGKFSLNTWLAGNPSLAMQELESIPDMENRQAIIDGALEQIVRGLTQKGWYEQALDAAGKISDQQEIAELYDAVYFGMAKKELQALADLSGSQFRLSAAIDLLEKCSPDSGFSRIGEGLRQLRSGNCVKAAELLADVEDPELREILPDVMIRMADEELDWMARLPWIHTAAGLRDPSQASSAAALQNRLRSAMENNPGFSFQTSEFILPFSDAGRNTRFSWSWDGSPEGKILILRQDSYDRNAVFADLGLTGRLPQEYIPERPEQVEYVVILTYDAECVGSYILTGAEGLKEYGRVSVYSVPEGEYIATSGVVYGEDPPEAISTERKSPYVSGGAPDLSEALYQALEKLIGAA